MSKPLSNRARAHRCGRAIAAYGDDLPESNLIDFLTDAMHWCIHNGGNFHWMLAQACCHFVNELNESQVDERRIS